VNLKYNNNNNKKNNISTFKILCIECLKLDFW